MPYRVLEHTADIGIEVIAESYQALLGASVEALMDLVVCTEGDPRESSSISSAGQREGALRQKWMVQAFDKVELLHDVLSEALFRFECEHYIPTELSIAVDPCGDELCAIIQSVGRRVGPDDLMLREVKAVTYHGLTVNEVDEQVVAVVYFDL